MRISDAAARRQLLPFPSGERRETAARESNGREKGGAEAAIGGSERPAGGRAFVAKLAKGIVVDRVSVSVRQKSLVLSHSDVTALKERKKERKKG